MRNVASIFALTVMSLALVFMGPVSRAVALSDTTMAELCLDGVVQVVRLGRDGEPVSPKQDCGQNHACCVMSSDPAVPNIVAEKAALFFEQGTTPGATGALIRRLEFLLAGPRGPPAAQIGQIDQMEIRS